MIYRDFKDEKLSALGMGCMRLPVIDGDDSKIDVEQTEEMVAYAMEHGINYYDTAWGYHGGNSELVIGEALSKYPRESFNLTTKFPGYDLKNMPKVVEIFEEQLSKLKVDYFDFYLIHNVCELNIDEYLNEEHGIYAHLMKQKENGRIRHLGFSTHGSLEVMRRFLEKYGEGMEFCQIQLNYVDWDFQDAKEKIELCKEYGLPVWVMEPLRGGMLGDKLPDEYAEKIKAIRPDETATAMAFRFLQSISEVKMVLTGASNFDQLKENIAIFEEDKPLTDGEKEQLISVASDMLSDIVPCTACSYCVSHCPQELPIPHLIGLYNENKFTPGGFIAPMALAALPKEKRPRNCIGCRACEAVCPQQIKISEIMADFASGGKK